jgi:protein SFI1
VLERSRSLVGYTPTPSILDDDSGYNEITFDPPIRTSTPLQAFRKPRDGHSPELPPYSVSDISESRRGGSRIDLDEEDAQLVQGLGTPKAYYRDLPLTEDVQHEDVNDEEGDAEMEMTANKFFETGLMGRCWDVWSQSAQWIQVGIPSLVKPLGLTGD